MRNDEILRQGALDAKGAEEVRSMYRRLTETLIARGLSITTMESCTAGQIASLITDTEGASAILKGAFVTYSNEAKVLQGVPEETIRRFGVYSPETAEAMAQACRKAYRADIGVGITGSMGNIDPANRDSVPGEVYFAIDSRAGLQSRKLILEPQESRLMGKLAAAKPVARCLLALLDASGGGPCAPPANRV